MMMMIILMNMMLMMMMVMMMMHLPSSLRVRAKPRHLPYIYIYNIIYIIYNIYYIYIYIIHRIYLKTSPMSPPQPWNISSNALCKESPSLQVDLMLRWKCPISPVWKESILGVSKSNSYFTNCNDILYGDNIWHMVYDYMMYMVRSNQLFWRLWSHYSSSSK